MMKCDGNKFLSFLFTVAIVCCEGDRPENNHSPGSCAAYIKAILEVALGCAERHDIRVEPMVYPASCKVPLIIRIDGSDPCLFWFYPSGSVEELASDLCSLLSDCIAQPSCIPA